MDYNDATAGDAGNATTFACDLCSGLFKSQRNLNDHIRGKHLARQTYSCLACGLRFRWRSTLSSHRKKGCPLMAQERTDPCENTAPVTVDDVALSLNNME